MDKYTIISKKRTSGVPMIRVQHETGLTFTILLPIQMRLEDFEIGDVYEVTIVKA